MKRFSGNNATLKMNRNGVVFEINSCPFYRNVYGTPVTCVSKVAGASSALA